MPELPDLGGAGKSAKQSVKRLVAWAKKHPALAVGAVGAAVGLGYLAYRANKDSGDTYVEGVPMSEEDVLGSLAGGVLPEEGEEEPFEYAPLSPIPEVDYAPYYPALPTEGALPYDYAFTGDEVYAPVSAYGTPADETPTATLRQLYAEKAAEFEAAAPSYEQPVRGQLAEVARLYGLASIYATGPDEKPMTASEWTSKWEAQRVDLKSPSTATRSSLRDQELPYRLPKTTKVGSRAKALQAEAAKYRDRAMKRRLTEAARYTGLAEAYGKKPTAPSVPLAEALISERRRRVKRHIPAGV